MQHQQTVKSEHKQQPGASSSAMQQSQFKQGVAHPPLRLQRTIGNQAVQQMQSTQEKAPGDALKYAFREPRIGHDFSQIPIHAPATRVIQAKLTINQPGDEYEQEADHVAEQVMRMPEPKVQRAWHSEQQGQEHTHMQLRRVQPGDTRQTVAPSSVHEVLRSPGQPLDTATRGFMESCFGHNFSDVRVHSGVTAAQSALHVNAKAYTVGPNVVFGTGQFMPGTHEGRRLLAHELTHVVQQSGMDKMMRVGESNDRSPIGLAVQHHTTSLQMQRSPVPGIDKPQSLEASLRTEALTDEALMHEIELIIQWLDANPAQSFERDHLSLELKRLGVVEEQRIERVQRQQKYREGLAKVIEAVNAGHIPRWMKVFPFRPSRGPFRLDVAPIMARREGESIVVMQPLIGVKYTDRFKKDVKTLPWDVFQGGHTLQPNELVGVRLYDEDEKVIVCYAKDLLEFSRASDNALFTNIALTAASVLAGPAIGRLGGRILGAVGESLAPVAQRGLFLTRLAVGTAEAGAADAAPTALGGIASRTSVTLVEGRAASIIAQQAIEQTTIRAGTETVLQSLVDTGVEKITPSLTGSVGTVGGMVSIPVVGQALQQVAPAPTTATVAQVAQNIVTARTRSGFMQAAKRAILNKQGHLLHFLMDGSDWRKTTRITQSGSTQTGRYEANESGVTVQAGHQGAKASGVNEQYMLEDADFNQIGGNTIESKGVLSFKIAVVIDGVPVDLASAMQWERLGLLPAGTVANALRILPPTLPSVP